MPLFGPPDVEKLKAKRDVKGLAKALRDNDRLVRADAAAALGELGEPSAVEPLIDALRDEDWRVPVVAAEALGRLGDARAIEPLAFALAKRGSVTKAALEALQTLHPERAVAALTPCLGRGVFVEPWGQRKAAIALGELGRPEAFEPLLAALQTRSSSEESQSRIKAVADSVPLELLAEHAGAADNARARIARVLVEAATRPGDPEVLKDLITGREDDVLLRAVAAMALGRLGDARAVDPLLQVLTDEEPAVRGAAAGALGALRRTHVVPALVLALEDGERSPGATLAALASMEKATLVSAVFEQEARAKVLFARTAAAAALGELGEPAALEPLIRALGDERPVDLAAAVAAHALGSSRGVSHLVAALDDGRGLEAASARLLGRCADPQAVEPLIAVLAHEDAAVREAAAASLGELGDRRASAPLEELLEDGERSVRVAAAFALGALGDREAVRRHAASLLA